MVTQIEKERELLGHPMRTISSQAGKKFSEGSTTIPSGSTPQANGGGSALRPVAIQDDDIVSSSRQREAVGNDGYDFASHGEDKRRT